MVHLVKAPVAARLYPVHRFDPDLIGYFIYFRGLLTSSSVLQVTFVPKPFMVFVLGPLDDPSLAFAVSAVIGALLGMVVYLIGCDAFGRLTGVLWSAALLLDPWSTFLTLTSSADLYLTAFLYLAVWLTSTGRLFTAAGCRLLSALVKPVTLPVVLALLATDAPRDRRWAAALLPLAALPLTLVANRVLLGSFTGSGQYLQDFSALREIEAITPGELVHFALWRQMVKTSFVTTAPFGFLGLLAWLGRDRRHLTHPLLLMPLLFLGGYLLLAMANPYMPFFRFFWPLEVLFLGFLIYGIVEVARHLGRGQQWAQLAAGGLLLFFLTDDCVAIYLRYREHFAIPMERNLVGVTSAAAVLRREWVPGESILAPLAFQPYLSWSLHADAARAITSAEHETLTVTPARPRWVLHVPAAYLSTRARELVERLVSDGGYQPRFDSGAATLYVLPGSLTPPLAAQPAS